MITTVMSLRASKVNNLQMCNIFLVNKAVNSQFSLSGSSDIPFATCLENTWLVDIKMSFS